LSLDENIESERLGRRPSASTFDKPDECAKRRGLGTRRKRSAGASEALPDRALQSTSPNVTSPDPTTQNPLLTLANSVGATDEAGARVVIPFDRIAAEHVEPAVRELLRDAQSRVDAMAAPKPVRSYEDTLHALESATERLELAMNVIEHLEGVRTTPELRKAFEAVQPAVSAFVSGIPLSAEVWGAIKAFAATKEAAALTGARKRFLQKTVAEFRRSGADLDPKGKERLAAIEVELAELTLKFGQNVLDSTNAFEIVVPDASRLKGLPEAALAGARESAAAKGQAGYRLTLQAPSYIPALTYLDDAALRRDLYRAYNTRATVAEKDNRPLVEKIVALRREKATLLGYATFADLVCEDRMAKSGEAARRFVSTLRERATPFFARENEDLLAFRRELEGASAPPIEPWDVSYYAEKLRRARHDFDEEALRPYFAFERVLTGAFAVAERLYDVHIEPAPDAPVWHRDVRAYSIVEPGGKAAALFYVDVFPREDKRDGAWMHGLVSNVELTRPNGRHIAILAGNLTPPLGDAPALLSLREVETLFHEFGHLMHHASSRVDVRSLAGTNVARDFVELPSQIMENWCWEREALDLFARHHATNEPIPDALFQRMRGARAFRAANAMMRQLGFAELDLALHMEWDPKKDPDLVAYARAIQQRSSPAPLPADYAMVAAFSHLFASPVGYAAGYYSYKWAEVLDADAFARFKAEGLFNRKVGADFRAHILARGDSEDPAELYRRFRGRDATLDALLERDGLVA
jgi:oligopeptidase A